MHYLAQVLSSEEADYPNFLLLASQDRADLWHVLDPATSLASDRAQQAKPGQWVLLEVNESGHVLAVQDAKPWILSLIQRYLSLGVTPEFLQQETERAEQWRQSLTLQSQELDRRALELEARREQIQALEADLKREKQKLDEQ